MLLYTYVLHMVHQKNMQSSASVAVQKHTAFIQFIHVNSVELHAHVDLCYMILSSQFAVKEACTYTHVQWTHLR